ncbi:signal peptidase I [Fictibacillus sp. KU28468]|uniref:signal peptidase I n=1 Tax=Fictibacillus sp. KU28468 TaxID=2991053 RepID=UPI00223CBB78|nr:signal peptidase I [Fictibacillus sp. KU28468]UZJ79585.1 signal peptidase I [Fictibacillus sp. KU28468]
MISGNSMNPTIKDHNLIFISKLFYTPERENIILVENNDGMTIIKRLIGMPNDIIEIKDHTIYVNNKPLKENYTKGLTEDMKKVTLKAGQYFVIGDNRSPVESLECRDPALGPIYRSQMKGEALFSLLPFGKLNH